MSISERERIALVKSLEDAMGQRAAGTLMEYLPASGWRDVARVSDLEAAEARTIGKIDALDSRLTSKIDAVDSRLTSKIDALDSRLTSKIDAVEGRLTGKIETVRAEMHQELAKQFRYLVVILVTTLTAFGGMLIAAAQIYKP